MFKGSERAFFVMLPADLRRPGSPRATQPETDPPRPVHRPFAVRARAGTEDAGRFQPVPADRGGPRVRGRPGHRDHPGKRRRWTARSRPPTSRETRCRAPMSRRSSRENVALRRGDQFLGADRLTYDSQQEQYVADGNIRYQDSSMRLTAEHAQGNQATDEHQIDDLKYQLVARRGNGGVLAHQPARQPGQPARLHVFHLRSRRPPLELRANRIDVDSAKGFAVAHHAVLRIGKIPVCCTCRGSSSRSTSAATPACCSRRRRTPAATASTTSNRSTSTWPPTTTPRCTRGS
jgi:hypothetical protein